MSIKYILLLTLSTQFLYGVICDYYTPSEEVGKLLEKYDHRNDSRYPFELGLGYYYQGDIMLVPPSKSRVSVSEQYAEQIWPGGRVPYQILGSFTESQLSTINSAIELYNKHTCIRFVEKTDEDQLWIKIVNNRTGCWSYIGRQTDNQYNMINLNTPGCTRTVGTPVHEMMHALGYFHEQARPDRDEYISINRSALMPQYQTDEFYNSNFEKLEANEVETYKIPYDYGSVMHYSKFAGAASREYPVMNNKKPWDGDFGSETGFSENDIKQISLRYKCDTKKKSKKQRKMKNKTNLTNRKLAKGE
ncbi:zinc metalloproteinase nas-14-like [Uranotaenia lowii]|uniref:zinc metalloproteinase nas-14-like n=1 Tax=Uranotaenia lowii TaxID=190385 RepID=UPI0024798698|nr:zinc metalloproteinase nas-14-like [Uranotaenia lowii]